METFTKAYPAKTDIEQNRLDLKYRRQFVAAFESSNLFPHWQHCEISQEGLHIYAHPDLELSVVSSEDKQTELALLGFAIDPEYPNRTNEDILGALIDTRLDSVDALSAGVCNLAGRFVLIAAFSNQVYVFHDACGLRSVFYTERNGKVYLASQPLLFLEFFALEPADRYHIFNSSSYKRDDKLYFLPSGLSLYENVYQLIPNHYLDVRKSLQKRYWPVQPIPERIVEESAQESAEILTKLICAVHSRYKLTLWLTGGWDSRLLLAGSKNIADQVSAYTMILQHMTEQSPDVTIPQSICKHNRIHHEIIDCRCNVDPEFHGLVNTNIDIPHEYEEKMVYATLQQIPADRLAVTGTCSEIARCAYYMYGEHDTIVSGNQLALMTPGWEKIPFIVEHLEEWLKDATPVCADADIDLLDLFYWENRLGGWLSRILLEKDIAYESFSPYNYRPLLTTMLGVPIKYRREPNYLLYQRMIKQLWPELLEWPINPAVLSINKTVELHLREVLLDLGIYGQLRRIYKRISN